MAALAFMTVVLAVILGLIGLLKLGVAIWAICSGDFMSFSGGLICIIISVILFIVRFNFM